MVNINYKNFLSGNAESTKFAVSVSFQALHNSIRFNFIYRKPK